MTLSSADGTSSGVTPPSRKISQAPLSIRTNFAWVLAGNFVASGSLWAIFVLLAKLGHPGMIGQFTLGLAITAPVMLLAGLQLPAVQATDIREEFSFGDYMRVRVITTVLGLVTIAGIVCSLDHERETAQVIVIVALVKAVESVSEVLHGWLQRHERMDRIAISLVLRGVLSLAAVATGVIATGKLVAGVALLIIVRLLVLLLYDLPNGPYRLEPSRILSIVPHLVRRAHKADWRKLMRLAWLAFPLGGVMALTSLNVNIPRYIIAHSLGERELGIFAAIFSLTTAGSLAVSSLAQSARPRLATHYANGDLPAFRALLLKQVGVGVLAGGAGIVFVMAAGSQLLATVYTPEYAARVDVFLWLMIGAALSYIAAFQDFAMTAARLIRPQLPLFLAVSGATAAAALVLIPRYGLVGAGWTFIVTMSMQSAGGLWFTFRRIR